MGCQTLKMYCKITSLSKQNVKKQKYDLRPVLSGVQTKQILRISLQSTCLWHGTLYHFTTNNVVKWAEVPSLNYDVSHQGSCQGKEDMCIRRPIIVHTASYLIGSQEHRTSVISLPWPCIGSIPVKHAAAK